MTKVKLTNIWVKKSSIPLELATQDVGKGFKHVRLPYKASLVVDEEELSAQIRGLAVRRRHRKPALLIEDLEIREVKEYIPPAPEPEIPSIPIEDVPPDGLRERLSRMLKSDLQVLIETAELDIEPHQRKDDLVDSLLLHEEIVTELLGK